jgi:kynurenine formamidase
VDLGRGFDDTTVVFPGGEPFRFTDQHAGEDPSGNWYSANNFITAEHCGTHLDAPYHFHKNGRTVGQIPIEKLLVKGKKKLE